MGNGGRIANILLPRGSVFLAAPCAFLCGIVHGIRPRVFPPIKANLRYHFCYHYFKSHPPFSDQVCRILEKVTLDLADSRATGFSEDATKTVFRFRLQHVALCCIGVTPGGGALEPRMRMVPKSRAANFLSSDSASGPAECLRGSCAIRSYLSYSTPTKGVWPIRCHWAFVFNGAAGAKSRDR